MTVFDLINVLALDGLKKVLTFDERAELQQTIRGGSQKISPKVNELLRIIKQHNWNKPETQYKETEIGKLLFYKSENDEWERIGNYHHPILDEITSYQISDEHT